MTELAFALEFRGQARSLEGSGALRQARTVAPSQVCRTIIGADGVESAVEFLAGAEAVLESRVERFLDGGFVEDGRIAYGSAGAVTFVTVGRGHAGPSPREGWHHGAVIWSVTGGEGRFAGAQGLITSSFAVGPDGLVIDHHWARLFLP